MQQPTANEKPGAQVKQGGGMGTLLRRMTSTTAVFQSVEEGEDKFSQLVSTIDEKYQKTILMIYIEREIKQKKWEVYKYLKHNNTPGFTRSAIEHILLPLILFSGGRKLHYQISDKELEAELKIAETKEKKKETVFKTKEEKTKCNDDSTVTD